MAFRVMRGEECLRAAGCVARPSANSSASVAGPDPRHFVGDRRSCTYTSGCYGGSATILIAPSPPALAARASLMRTPPS